MNISDYEDDYKELYNIEDYDGAFAQYYEASFFKYSDLYDSPSIKFLLAITIVNSCICAVGYVGNIITCIVIACNKSMHTTTNIYLFNLAIADLVMLTSGLVELILSNWFRFKTHRLYGLKGCFIFSWLSDTSVNVSIMTITAFTFERYLAICRPFVARMILSISKALTAILLIWIVGTVFGYLIGSQMKSKFLLNESMCILDKTIPYIIEIESIVFFVMPFTFIVILYILIGKKLVESSNIQKNQGSNKNAEGSSKIQNDDSSNRQIFKMLVIVVAVFFMCWAPFHFRRLFVFYEKELLPNSFFEDYVNIEFVLTNIHCIAYFLSSALNPIIYSAMSKKFRDAFKEVFKCGYISRQKLMTKIIHRSKTTETTTV